MLLWILLIVVLFLAWNTRESMTNKDLISTLKTYGDKTKKPTKSSKPEEGPIYGPKVEPIVHPTPTPSSSTNSSSIYPDIYGPEYKGVPGSDPVKDTPFEFNPDLKKAFPTEGEPQPFLTDFSKFQH